MAPASSSSDRRVARTRPVSASAALGGVSLIATLLTAICLLAGPLGLVAIGGLMLVVLHTAGFLITRLTLILRFCELARTPSDLLELPAWRSTARGRALGRPRAPGNTRSATGGEGAAGMNFWDALDSGERLALQKFAVVRDFTDGAEIFRKGDQADHVIVIRRGRTKVCLRGIDGRERILARRGPGELVGERGALEVKVRSATVVAEGPVSAWVVRTRDFADFIEAHPHVLEIVEGQVYWRLTEPSTAGGANPGETCPDCGRGHGTPIRLNGDNCTILVVDVAGFGGEERTDNDRRFIRRTLLEILEEAFAESRIALDECHWEDRGDGFLVVVPPHAATTARVLESVPHRLGYKLRRHNRRTQAAGRIRLRLAVHVGPVVSDRSGVSGDAIIHAARLIEASAFKRRLTQRAACLGIIVSAHVYATIIQSALAAVEASAYERITCKVKESRVVGWMSFDS